jgi:short-subunit dehydrogenase
MPAASEAAQEVPMKRPLAEQVVVITGASSGIGRETALAFGKRGARVMLAARNKEALDEVASEIELMGGRAGVAVTDVSEWQQVFSLAESTVEQFGRIDTWINNAAISEYSPFDEMTIDEIDQIIKVDLLGTIYGAKAALPIMKAQDQGTIMNVGSALSDRAIPLQSMYCACKHGIRGFTDALRVELERENSKVDVTLIQPASVNTPFFEHARSKVGAQPRPVPPVYQPSAVAETILHAAEHSVRNVHVGAAGMLLGLAEKISPRLLDRWMLLGDQGVKSQVTDKPDDRQDNLFSPMPGRGKTRGEFGRLAQPTSIYTRAIGLHPNRGRIAAAASGVIGAFALRRRLSD